MEKATFSEVLIKLMVSKGWKNKELSRESGIPITTISAWKKRKITRRVTPERLKKLADAFGDEGYRLYEALGYPVPAQEERKEETTLEIAERLIQKLKLSTVQEGPVFTRFFAHAGAVHEEITDYVYLPRTKEASENIQAFIVRGQCLSPKVENGDIVIVDRDRSPEPGNLLLCLRDNELVVGHYLLKGEEAWLSNGEEELPLSGCQATAVVIQIIKRTV